ncbi:MAG: hypothetical protein ACRDN9_08520 [Streptosporangiaceae bacterium]
MIVISGALVIIVIALLIAGIVTATLMLIYASIGVSIVSLLCLGIGVFLLRAELFARDSPVDDVTEPRPEAGRTSEPEPAVVGAPASTGASEGAPEGTATGISAGRPQTKPRPSVTPTTTKHPPPSSAPAATVPGDTRVFVVQGRRRYHLASCRQLAGRSPDELPYSDARERGYTACTACMPDTALAARTRPVKDEAPKDEALHTSDEAPQDEDAPLDEGDVSDDSTTGGAPPGHDRNVRVVAGRKRFHRDDCAVVKDAEEEGAEVETTERAAAERDGCTPCTICRP